MTDWSLRLARREDAVAMPVIERAAASLFASIDGLPSIALAAPLPVERLQRYIATGHCLVAHRNGEMAGFITTRPVQRELHVHELSVHPDHQRRGIGAGLVRAAMIDARNSGFAALTLTTFRNVAWNAAFYERLGFIALAEPVDHPRLAEMLKPDAKAGLPADSRCAMIRFLE